MFPVLSGVNFLSSILFVLCSKRTQTMNEFGVRQSKIVLSIKIMHFVHKRPSTVENVLPLYFHCFLLELIIIYNTQAPVIILVEGAYALYDLGDFCNYEAFDLFLFNTRILILARFLYFTRKMLLLFVDS